ncbi:hypothetical protein JCM8208_006557 [Rhodotorula glutinis]
MGIGGLLPLLKEIQHTAHVREWAGKTVAVDGYVWLHRGAYGCAEDLALGKPTTKYVNYAMHRVRMLKHFGVTPVLVFDGGLLPSKMGTEDAREAKRADALARGRAFLAEGKGGQARECFVKAVDVTPAMAFQLIKALRREKVQYVVAPYEADPQLAYLERAGLVDAVVTEDSDLLVFGCRNVLFKLDGEGNCVSISRDDFSRCRDFNFAGWSEVEFRQMAILSGCDYLDSVVGLGLKTAYRLLRKYKTPEKVIQFIRLEGQLTVPRTYLDEFRRAEKTFLHQHVFDPVKRELVHLTPLPEGVTADDLPFIGPMLDGDFARGVADGNIDPITKLAMVDLVPDSLPSTSAPYKPQPFKRSTASTTATGKPAGGSLLSYFSPAPAASTSSSKPSNPAKAAKARAKVTLVGGLSSASAKGKGKQKEEEGEPQEARQSKFFGTAAASAKGEGTAPVVEVAEEDEAALGLAADDSGFLECLELPPCSDDLDAEAALRDVELSVEMRSVVAVDEDDDAPAAAEMDESPTPTDVAATSFVLSSTPAISSPPATPPRTRAQLVGSPSAVDVGVVPPSEAGISSPAQSTVAQAGWDNDELSSPIHAAVKLERMPETEVKREKEQEQQHTATPMIELSSDPILLSSSPGAAPTPRPSVSSRDVKPAPSLKLKGKGMGKAPARSPEGKTKASPRRSKVVGVDVRADEGAPRSSLSSSAGKAAKAAKASGSGRKRKRVKEEPVEEDEDEGKDPAAKALAESWRARFSLPAANKTPLGRPSFGQPSPPTPQAATRPLAPPAAAQRARAPASPKKRTATTDLSRTPLSPRSRNRTSTSTSTAAVAQPPRPGSPLKHLKRSAAALSQEDVAPVPGPSSKKRRTSAHGPAVVALPSSPPRSSNGILSSSAPDEAETSSSSPVVVTNPRLLAFRFTGSVRRS